MKTNWNRNEKSGCWLLTSVWNKSQSIMLHSLSLSTTNARNLDWNWSEAAWPYRLGISCPLRSTKVKPSTWVRVAALNSPSQKHQTIVVNSFTLYPVVAVCCLQWFVCCLFAFQVNIWVACAKHVLKPLETPQKGLATWFLLTCNMLQRYFIILNAWNGLLQSIKKQCSWPVAPNCENHTLCLPWSTHRHIAIDRHLALKLGMATAGLFKTRQNNPQSAPIESVPSWNMCFYHQKSKLEEPLGKWNVSLCASTSK